MSIELLNPEGLMKPEVYVQVSVATGRKTLFLAGQVAYDAAGKLQGKGDLAAQAELALLNVATGLAGAGASFADVAKLTIYVVKLSPEMMPKLLEGLGRAGAKLQVDTRRPATLLGVHSLSDPDLLVEVEATAVV